MKVILSKSSLYGVVDAPRSKSVAQRLILASIFTHGKSIVGKLPICDDVYSAINVLSTFNIEYDVDEKREKIEIGIEDEVKPIKNYVNLGESGTTYRIAIGIYSTFKDVDIILDCGKLMRRRPILELVQALNKLGAKIEFVEEFGYPPVKIRGGLKGGKIEIRGDISSQYISSLIYAGINSENGIEIIVRQPIVSKEYIELTCKLLKYLKGDVEYIDEEDRLRIFSYPSELRSFEIEVPGDYALSAFIFATVAVTGEEVVVRGFNNYLNPVDSIFIDILKNMEIDIKEIGDLVYVRTGIEPRGIEVDLKDNPDLVPPLTIIASFAKGETKILNVRHLAYKESNRLKTINEVLTLFNIPVKVIENRHIIVKGVEKTVPIVYKCPDDHRIAMLAGCIALNTQGKSILENVECVRKSWPRFWNVLKDLGAEIEIRED